MIGPLKLAIKYIAFNKFKSLILIGCIFLTALLPIAIELLLSQFNQKVLARADATPIVIGSKGSSLDLTLHALYFKTDNTPDSFPFVESANVRETQLAVPIPIHVMFTAQNYPLVGTTIDYFEFRKLSIQSGDRFAMLGDCVIGAGVAKKLGLAPGDQLLSDRESVIDIAGLYPLNMKIVGVLAPNRTADDLAVFVDLKTAWVIQGLGHGHQDLANETDEGKILSRDAEKVIASAAVLPYTEINDSNLDSFHFHGNTDDFPITAIVAVAPDMKSQTILEGKFDSKNQTLQFTRPSIVVRDLMSMLFRVKLFFDANAIMIAVSTILLMVLVILLSLKLRSREMSTMFKIGCSRGTIVMLQFWELAMIFFVAIVLLALAITGLWSVSGNLIEWLLLNSSDAAM